MADDLAARLSLVESLLSDLKAEVVDLRAENARLRAEAPIPEPVGAPEPGPDAGRALGRRRLLVGGATAGAAAVAGVVATGQPAAAANGGNMILGQNNTATAETKLTYGGSSNNGFRVEGASSLALIEGFQTGSAAGVKGASTSTDGVGVSGLADDGYGVSGSSANVLGVYGTSESGTGVYGTSADGFGAFGNSENSIGVRGRSLNSIGVVGESFSPSTPSAIGVDGSAESGIGVRGTGTTGVVGSSSSGVGVSGQSVTGTALQASGFIGAQVLGQHSTLRLQPAIGRQAPTGDTVAHTFGDVVIDATGALWYCTNAGTPGTWRKLGGPSTSGQLHVLPAPARVYDSRPGTLPTAVGPKTQFAVNETRIFDLKANSSGVPAGATAALVTILLVNAATSAGNATIWANGVAKPLANTMVWGGTATRFTATAVTALDAQARVQFNASLPTNLVLDVVGYYR